MGVNESDDGLGDAGMIEGCGGRAAIEIAPGTAEFVLVGGAVGGGGWRGGGWRLREIRGALGGKGGLRGKVTKGTSARILPPPPPPPWNSEMAGVCRVLSAVPVAVSATECALGRSWARAPPRDQCFGNDRRTDLDRGKSRRERPSNPKR